MQLASVRKYNKVARRLRGLLMENPVLYGGLALPFAISATFSLQNGVALSIMMALTTLPVLLAASLIRRRIPRPFRIITYSFLAVFMLFPGAVPDHAHCAEHL
jgi:Na+-transporting NADH:ubiquinone oxidoreductase subunit NqrD